MTMMGLEFVFIGAFIAGALLVSYSEARREIRQLHERLEHERARRERERELLEYEEAEARKLRTEYR